MPKYDVGISRKRERLPRYARSDIQIYGILDYL